MAEKRKEKQKGHVCSQGSQRVEWGQAHSFHLLIVVVLSV
jgi:hypothetical protein